MLARIRNQSTILSNEVYSRLQNNQCVLCLEPCAFNNGLCELCWQSLPRPAERCPLCAEPNPLGLLCKHCQSRPPSFRQVLFPFTYESPMDFIIQRFKSGKNLANPQLFSALNDVISEHHFDAIIPMPYHWRRLWRKGHSPTLELAHGLSKLANIPCVNGLRRIRWHPPQQGLSRTQRLANVRGVFACHSVMHHYKNKHVLLVDDVLTTGATAESASVCLLRAGVASVSIACLARTPSKTIAPQ